MNVASDSAGTPAAATEGRQDALRAGGGGHIGRGSSRHAAQYARGVYRGTAHRSGPIFLGSSAGCGIGPTSRLAEGHVAELGDRRL